VIHIRTQIRRWTMRLLLASVVAATCLGAVSATASAHGPATAGGPDHIFYIMMENHALDQIIGNTQDAPFINSLAAQSRVATGFHGVTHPSLVNYLSATSGYFQGIFDDCKAGADVFCAPEEFIPDSGDGTSVSLLTQAQIDAASNTPHMFDSQNIVDQLEAKGISWKAYMENLPSPGAEDEYAPVIGGTTVKLYAQKHDPFMYFSDINYPGSPRLDKIVPFEGNFMSDLQNGTVPNFAWISPNQCHDMHGISPGTAALIDLPACGFPDSGLDHGAIQLGDQWLQQTVTAIKQSSTWQNSSSEIIIAWDENDYSTDTSGGPFSPTGQNGVVLGGGPAPLIVVSNRGPSTLVNSAPTDHYTTLYAIERMWNLGCLANTCNISPAMGNTFMNLFRP